MTHTLTIPRWLPPTINALMFGSVRRRIKLTKECKEFVATYAQPHVCDKCKGEGRVYCPGNALMMFCECNGGYVYGIPKAKGKRRVTLKLILGRRNKTRDKDSSHKAVLDALKTASLIVDDSPEWCECTPLEQERAKESATVIILEDL
jgi:hypothetical protein